MKRLLLTLSLLFLIFAFTWAIANRKHLSSFSTIPSSYHAKGYCSCRFVVQRTKEQCQNMLKSILDIESIKEDDTKKTITVEAMGQTNTAHFVSEQLGCILDTTSK